MIDMLHSWFRQGWTSGRLGRNSANCAHVQTFLLISTREHGSHVPWLAAEYVLRHYKTNLFMSSQLTLVTYDSCFWRKLQDVRCSGFQRESGIPSVAGFLKLHLSTLSQVPCAHNQVHARHKRTGRRAPRSHLQSSPWPASLLSP